MERLAEAGYFAIAPDLRGFGESEAAASVEDATAFDVLGDLIELLEHLGIQRAAVVAHHRGASLGWQLVQLRPDRFEPGSDAFAGFSAELAAASVPTEVVRVPGLIHASLNIRVRAALSWSSSATDGEGPKWSQQDHIS